MRRLIPVLTALALAATYPGGSSGETMVVWAADGHGLATGESVSFRLEAFGAVKIVRAYIHAPYGSNWGWRTSVGGELNMSPGSVTVPEVWVPIPVRMELKAPLAIAASEIWGPDGTQLVGWSDRMVLPLDLWHGKVSDLTGIGPVSYADEPEGMYYTRLAGFDKKGGLAPPLDVSEPMFVEPVTGDKTGPTEQAVAVRLSEDIWTFETWEAAYDPITDIFPGTRRVVLLPIVETDGTKTPKQVEVVAFAAVFIEGYSRATGFTCYFIRSLSVREAAFWNPFGGGVTPL